MRRHAPRLGCAASVSDAPSRQESPFINGLESETEKKGESFVFISLLLEKKNSFLLLFVLFVCLFSDWVGLILLLQE